MNSTFRKKVAHDSYQIIPLKNLQTDWKEAHADTPQHDIL
jgi:hypothetical protein